MVKQAKAYVFVVSFDVNGFEKRIEVQADSAVDAISSARRMCNADNSISLSCKLLEVKQ